MEVKTRKSQDGEVGKVLGEKGREWVMKGVGSGWGGMCADGKRQGDEQFRSGRCSWGRTIARCQL